MNHSSNRNWKFLKRLTSIVSPWVNVYLEQWRDSNQQILDYWRVERPHSIIVIPIHRDQLLLPRESFRVGIREMALDFPGGRLQEDEIPQSAALTILHREMGVSGQDIKSIKSLNGKPWVVDSSFSSQRLWTFVAFLKDEADVQEEFKGKSFPATIRGIDQLLEKLDCLQCWSALMEWRRQSLNEQPDLRELRSK